MTSGKKTSVYEELRAIEEDKHTRRPNANHHPIGWQSLLAKESGQVADAVVKGDWQAYRARLLQTASVAIAAVESLDRCEAPFCYLPPGIPKESGKS